MKHLYQLAAALVAGSAVAAHAATPDFSGVWQIAKPVVALTAIDGSAPPLLPAAKAIQDKYLAQKAAGDFSYDPAKKCKPLGNPRILLQGEAFKIVQNKKQLWFFYENNNQVRWVNLNVQPDPNAFTTYFGTNTGSFAGGALVVQGQLYNDFTFLDDSALPHSDMLVTTETYHLSADGKQLVEDIKFNDPKIFAHDWSTELTFTKLPTDRVGVDSCEDHIDTSKFY